LLTVGPRGDGSLCPLQVDRLRAVGAWLRANGEAIYGTRPWRIPAITTKEGREVRFTTRGSTIYAITLDGSDKPVNLVGLDGLYGRTGTALGGAGSFAQVLRFPG
jgi:alpha-L-fucosidase